MAVLITTLSPGLPDPPAPAAVVQITPPLYVWYYPFGAQATTLLPPLTQQAEPYQNCWVFIDGAWRPATVM